MEQNTYRPNQQTMQHPPAILTGKDLDYLKDAMSWELLVMKKCRHFAQECSDGEIRQAIDRAGRIHEKHFKILLKHVDPNQTPGKTH